MARGRLSGEDPTIRKRKDERYASLIEVVSESKEPFKSFFEPYRHSRLWRTQQFLFFLIANFSHAIGKSIFRKPLS